MILDDIFHVLRGERAYQVRRWGVRQPDHTIAEQPHSVASFVIFMRDRYEEARHYLARSPDTLGSLSILRKVVALAVACLEQNDKYDDRQVTAEDIFETIRRSGRVVPVRFYNTKVKTDFGTYLLKIGQSLTDAEVKLAAMNTDAALVIVWEIIQIGVECFEQYGVPGRPVVDVPVTNMRDGLPA
jgi:hypothetical protein